MENRRIPVKWVVSGYIEYAISGFGKRCQICFGFRYAFAKGPGVCREFAGSKPWALYADNRGVFSKEDAQFFQEMLNEIERKKHFDEE